MKLMVQLIVRIAYLIASLSYYQTFKHSLKSLLVNEGKIKHIFDFIMIILVLVTIFLLMYEVKHPLKIWMLNLQDIAIIIFIFEYLGRIWVVSDTHKIIIEMAEYQNLLNQPLRLKKIVTAVLRPKWDYMTTPLAVIDLLAILPSYRPLRVLRIFLLFRLFKLFRYTRSVNAFFNVLSQKKFELYTLTIFLSFVVFASAAAIYIFEVEDNDKIENFFDAIYWSLVTVTTVGYGDITPSGFEGRIITIILILSGLGVISFATSIIVSAFNEKLEELKEHRILAEVERLNSHTIICGFGKIGQVLARQLKESNHDYVVIDKDPIRINMAKKWGYLSILGDATKSQMLLDLGITKNCSNVVCATKSDAMNIFITITARSLDKNVYILSRVGRSDSKKSF